MKNFELKSQKLDEILGLENLMKLKVRLDLTHKNNCNSLNFWRYMVQLLDLVGWWTYPLYLQWLCRVWMVVTDGDVFPSS